MNICFLRKVETLSKRVQNEHKKASDADDLVGRWIALNKYCRMVLPYDIEIQSKFENKRNWNF